MKIKILFIALVFITALSSCQKDLATSWVGTYNGSTTGGNNVSRVVVTKVNDKTIKMELQSNVLGAYYTYATIGNGSLASATTVGINEDGTVYSYSGTYHFSGGGSLNGNALTLTGAATQTGKTTLYYSFSGSK